MMNNVYLILIELEHLAKKYICYTCSVVFPTKADDTEYVIIYLLQKRMEYVGHKVLRYNLNLLTTVASDISELVYYLMALRISF